MPCFSLSSDGRSWLTTQTLALEPLVSHVPLHSLLHHFLGQKLGQEKVLEEDTVCTRYWILYRLKWNEEENEVRFLKKCSERLLES